MSNILELENVTKIFTPKGRKEVAALNDITLKVEKGKFKVVCGPSGCGKSTLLLAAGGLLKPDPGTVHINGENIYKLTSEQKARFRADNLGFVFQRFHLIPFLNVLENVMAPTLAVSRDDAESSARCLIDYVGLSHRMDHPPSELSTGEQQRVALARAMLNEPSLVLADEPTGNLDEKNAQIVLKHLRDFASQGGGVLVATHDTNIEADEKYELKDGALVAHKTNG